MTDLPDVCAQRECTDDATSPDGYCGPHQEASDAEWDRITARIARRNR